MEGQQIYSGRLGGKRYPASLLSVFTENVLLALRFGRKDKDLYSFLATTKENNVDSDV